jgi:hypothetical protein
VALLHRLAGTRAAAWWGSGGEWGAEFEEIKAGGGEARKPGAINSQLI